MAMPTIEMKSGLKSMCSDLFTAQSQCGQQIAGSRESQRRGNPGERPESVEGLTEQREGVDMEGGSWPSPGSGLIIDTFSWGRGSSPVPGWLPIVPSRRKSRLM